MKAHPFVDGGRGDYCDHGKNKPCMRPRRDPLHLRTDEHTHPSPTLASHRMPESLRHEHDGGTTPHAHPTWGRSKR